MEGRAKSALTSSRSESKAASSKASIGEIWSEKPESLSEHVSVHAEIDEMMTKIRTEVDKLFGHIRKAYHRKSTEEAEPVPEKANAPGQAEEVKKVLKIAPALTYTSIGARNVIQERPRAKIVCDAPRDSSDDESVSEEEEVLGERPSPEEQGQEEEEKQEDGSDKDEEEGNSVLDDENLEAWRFDVATEALEQLLCSVKVEERAEVLQGLAEHFQETEEEVKETGLLMQQRESALGDTQEEYEQLTQKVKDEIEQRERKAYRLFRKFHTTLQKFGRLEKPEDQVLDALRLELKSGESKGKSPDVVAVITRLLDQMQKLSTRVKLESARLNAYLHANRVLTLAAQNGSEDPMQDRITVLVAREIKRFKKDGQVASTWLDVSESLQHMPSCEESMERLTADIETLKTKIAREDALYKGHLGPEEKTTLAAHIYQVAPRSNETAESMPSWSSNYITGLFCSDIQELYELEIENIKAESMLLENNIRDFQVLHSVTTSSARTLEETAKKLHEVSRTTKRQIQVGALPDDESQESLLKELHEANSALDRQLSADNVRKLQELEDKKAQLRRKVMFLQPEVDALSKKKEREEQKISKMELEMQQAWTEAEGAEEASQKQNKLQLQKVEERLEALKTELEELDEEDRVCADKQERLTKNQERLGHTLKITSAAAQKLLYQLQEELELAADDDDAEEAAIEPMISMQSASSYVSASLSHTQDTPVAPAAAVAPALAAAPVTPAPVAVAARVAPVASQAPALKSCLKKGGNSKIGACFLQVPAERPRRHSLPGAMPEALLALQESEKPAEPEKAKRKPEEAKAPILVERAKDDMALQQPRRLTMCGGCDLSQAMAAVNRGERKLPERIERLLSAAASIDSKSIPLNEAVFARPRVRMGVNIEEIIGAPPESKPTGSQVRKAKPGARSQPDDDGAMSVGISFSAGQGDSDEEKPARRGVRAGPGGSGSTISEPQVTKMRSAKVNAVGALLSVPSVKRRTPNDSRKSSENSSEQLGKIPRGASPSASLSSPTSPASHSPTFNLSSPAASPRASRATSPRMMTSVQSHKEGPSPARRSPSPRGDGSSSGSGTPTLLDQSEMSTGSALFEIGLPDDNPSRPSKERRLILEDRDPPSLRRHSVGVMPENLGQAVAPRSFGQFGPSEGFFHRIWELERDRAEIEEKIGKLQEDYASQLGLHRSSYLPVMPVPSMLSMQEDPAEIRRDFWKPNRSSTFTTLRRPTRVHGAAGVSPSPESGEEKERELPTRSWTWRETGSSPPSAPLAPPGKRHGRSSVFRGYTRSAAVSQAQEALSPSPITGLHGQGLVTSPREAS